MPVAKLSTLQKHAAFFDRNSDGLVRYGETVSGLKALGMPTVAAYPAAFAIHAGLGPKTDGGFNFTIKNIARGKHEGDTDVFTADGGFDKKQFNKLFARYDTNESGSLSSAEISVMQNDRAKTTFGKIATKGEFTLLMSLAGDTTEKSADGKSAKALSKERLQSFYDGSLFYTVEAERAAG